ncbi:MAG: four helix bundle protein [Wenzhouxiangellaceae bacterium]
MGTISRFEDIEAWIDARLLVAEVYKQCRSGHLAKDFGLRDQIQRAAVSIMANIAEGFERKNGNEFAHYLRIARGSCAEVQSHLYVALDANLIDKSIFDELQDMATKTGRKISAFQRYLKQNNRQ